MGMTCDCLLDIGEHNAHGDMDRDQAQSKVHGGCVMIMISGRCSVLHCRRPSYSHIVDQSNPVPSPPAMLLSKSITRRRLANGSQIMLPAT